MFTITIAPEAWQDIGWFRKAKQTTIIAAIEEQLLLQPQMETRNRKRLRLGHLTAGELRISDIRVFYDVDLEATAVSIVRVGYKERNKLFLRGEEHLP